MLPYVHKRLAGGEERGDLRPNRHHDRARRSGRFCALRLRARGHLRGETRVVHSPSRVQQAGGNIVAFEIRVVLKDLGLGRPGSEQSEHVGHPDPHAPDARPAATLPGAERDAS